MKKILCVGHSAYDITYLLPNFPIENRKYKAQDRIMVSGGSHAVQKNEAIENWV